MNNIKIFEKEEFGTIRVSMSENNEPLFCLADLCSMLELRSGDVRQRLDDGVVSTQPIIDTLGREQQANFVTEDGLYDVILDSRKESARDFRKWVTKDVLPSIRKNGLYATDNTIDMILNNPDFGIELLTKLKEERSNRIEAERRVAILTHVNKTYTVTEIAKELNMKSAQELNQKLADKKIQYNINGSWVMYSDYSNRAFEELKQEVLDNGKVIYHRRITQLGREFIIIYLLSEFYFIYLRI